MRRFRAVLACCGFTALLALAGVAAGPAHATAKQAVAPIRPSISDWQYLGNGVTPPSQAACNAVGRRCFNPDAMHHS